MEKKIVTVRENEKWEKGGASIRECIVKESERELLGRERKRQQE